MRGRPTQCNCMAWYFFFVFVLPKKKYCLDWQFSNGPCLTHVGRLPPWAAGLVPADSALARVATAASWWSDPGTHCRNGQTGAVKLWVEPKTPSWLVLFNGTVKHALHIHQGDSILGWTASLWTHESYPVLATSCGNNVSTRLKWRFNVWQMPEESMWLEVQMWRLPECDSNPTISPQVTKI